MYLCVRGIGYVFVLEVLVMYLCVRGSGYVFVC
jgi:hypothetical protein